MAQVPYTGENFAMSFVEINTAANPAFLDTTEFTGGSGSVRLDQILQGLKEVDVTLNSANSTTAATPGASLTLSSAQGNGQPSGNLNLQTADGPTGNDGGVLAMTSGAGGVSGGGGGGFGGNVNTIAGNGGAATGDGKTGGDGGGISSIAGNGGAGGIGGSGGQAFFQGGTGGTASVGAAGDGGAIIFRGGVGGDKSTGTTSGNGGDLNLDAGTKGTGTGGVDGAVNIATVQGDVVIGRLDAAVSTLQLATVRTGNHAAQLNELVRCDPTAGGFTITLPAINASTGRPAQIVVKNVSNSPNVITIATSGGNTIDGQATATISAARGALFLVSDGASDWMVI
jgi:hypothetical protein